MSNSGGKGRPTPKRPPKPIKRSRSGSLRRFRRNAKKLLIGTIAVGASFLMLLPLFFQGGSISPLPTPTPAPTPIPSVAAPTPSDTASPNTGQVYKVTMPKDGGEPKVEPVSPAPTPAATK